MTLKADHDWIDYVAGVAENVDPVASARIAAYIVIRSDVIGYGHNSTKTHPFQMKYGKNPQSIYLHAEIMAIKDVIASAGVNALDRLKKSTLYVARVKRPYSGSRSFIWGMAKPCEGCMRAIVEFGIKRVCYTTDNPDQIEEINVNIR